MSEACIFCRIVHGTEPASIVWEDERTMAFMDQRQFHPGHTLVIPRLHVADVRGLDRETGAALMDSVAQMARAVALAFPNQGLSLWHSIGEAADQEVPHLHFHVHTRLLHDGLLRVYPTRAAQPEKDVLDRHAAALRACLV